MYKPLKGSSREKNESFAAFFDMLKIFQVPFENSQTHDSFDSESYPAWNATVIFPPGP